MGIEKDSFRSDVDYYLIREKVNSIKFLFQQASNSEIDSSVDDYLNQIKYLAHRLYSDLKEMGF